MSAEAMQAVWTSPAPPGGAPARLVMLALAWRADQAGRTAPSVSELAAMTQITQRQVARHLAALRAAGTITEIGRRGRGIVTYRICSLTPMTDVAGVTPGANDRAPLTLVTGEPLTLVTDTKKTKNLKSAAAFAAWLAENKRNQ